MTAAARSLLIFAAVVAASGALQADGKIYVREDVPVSEPYQRALIAHEDGRQLLVVQPKLFGAAKDFAWVLPVPSPPALVGTRMARAITL